MSEPTAESITDTIRHARTMDELRATIRIFKRWARPPTGSEAAILSALRERALALMEEERVKMWAEILTLEQFFDKEADAARKTRLQLVSDR